MTTMVPRMCNDDEFTLYIYIYIHIFVLFVHYHVAIYITYNNHRIASLVCNKSTSLTLRFQDFG